MISESNTDTYSLRGSASPLQKQSRTSLSANLARVCVFVVVVIIVELEDVIIRERVQLGAAMYLRATHDAAAA